MERDGSNGKAAAPRARSARRLQVASDPASGWLTLWRLAVRGWFRRSIIRALAANSGAPKSLLWCLSSRRWDVQATVAANPRCPQRLHRSMAWSADWAVRAAVASAMQLYRHDILTHFARYDILTGDQCYDILT